MCTRAPRRKTYPLLLIQSLLFGRERLAVKVLLPETDLRECVRDAQKRARASPKPATAPRGGRRSSFAKSRTSGNCHRYGPSAPWTPPPPRTSPYRPTPRTSPYRLRTSRSYSSAARTHRRFSSLQELWLSGKAPELPAASLGRLTGLTCLRFDRNKSEHLPPEIGQLRSLRILSAESNRFEVLPREIGALTRLTQLSLSRNRLRTLPAEFSGLVALRCAWLAHNQLTQLPSLDGLRGLEILDLR